MDTKTNIKGLTKISNKAYNFTADEKEYSLRINLIGSEIEFSLIELQSFSLYTTQQNLLKLKLNYLFTKEKSIDELYNSVNVKVRTMDFNVEPKGDNYVVVFHGQVGQKIHHASIELIKQAVQQESHVLELAEGLYVDNRVKNQQIRVLTKQMQDIDTNHQSLDTSYQDLLDQNHYLKNELQEIKSVLELYRAKDNTTSRNNLSECLKKEPAIEKLYLDNIDSLPFKDKIKSKIIDYDDFWLIEKWIGRSVRTEMVYSSELHGDSAAKFHLRCDGVYPSLVIVESENGRRFGAFTTVPISTAEAAYKGEGNDFIYSLDSKRRFKNTDTRYAYMSTPFGLVAYGKGNDLYIHDKCCSNKQSYSNFPTSYGTDVKSEVTPDELAGSYNFRVKQIELFRIVYDLSSSV
jgi:hypothetical protein